MRYRATVNTFINKRIYAPGEEFETDAPASATWELIEGEEGERSPSEPAQGDDPAPEKEEGMTYEQIKARLTELGIAHKANDPKKKLLKLLPDPETFSEAAARNRALDGGAE